VRAARRRCRGRWRPGQLRAASVAGVGRIRDAFSDYGKRQQRLVSLIRQSESSRAAADLAAIRYREGTVDFLVLLDAQRERLAAEDSQAQAEVDLYRGIVAIYKALGGGWQPDTVVATAK